MSAAPFVPLLVPAHLRGVDSAPVRSDEAARDAADNFDAAAFVAALPQLDAASLPAGTSVLITAPPKGGKTTMAKAVLTAMAPSLSGGTYQNATPVAEPALKSVIAMTVQQPTGYLAEVSNTLLTSLPEPASKDILDALTTALQGVPNLTTVATTETHYIVPRAACAVRGPSVRCALPGSTHSDLRNAWRSCFSAAAPFNDRVHGLRRFYAAVGALPQYTALVLASLPGAPPTLHAYHA